MWQSEVCKLARASPVFKKHTFESFSFLPVTANEVFSDNVAGASSDWEESSALRIFVGDLTAVAYKDN